MTPPTLDDRLFDSPTFWIKRIGPIPERQPIPRDEVGRVPPYSSLFYSRLRLGQFVEMPRFVFLTLLGPPARQTIEWLFENSELEVEASVDGRRVPASWWRIRELPEPDPAPAKAIKRGRARLLELAPEQEDMARRAWTHRQESKTWAYLKSSASGVGLVRKTILKYWKILGLDPPR